MKSRTISLLMSGLALFSCAEPEIEPEEDGKTVVTAAFSTDKESYTAGDYVTFTNESVIENGTLSGYDNGRVTIETASGPVTLEKNEVALVRLYVEF